MMISCSLRFYMVHPDTHNGIQRRPVYTWSELQVGVRHRTGRVEEAMEPRIMRERPAWVRFAFVQGAR
jgi:hypothetical protein